jgi:diguanylate cyclase (GGDEF)-like protein
MVGIAMLGIGVLASESVKEMQLKRDGEETAMRWARMFDDERSNTFTMFRTRRTSEHVFTNIWNSLEVGRIVSYEIYDRNGKVFYTTGASDWQPSESADALLNSAITKRHINTGLPTTRLHTLNSPSGVSNYASVVIPFRLADSYQGSIVAFVDQTKHALSLTHSFKIIATATAILLLALLGTAVILVMRKGRERSEAEARARYLSDHDDLTGLPNRQSFVKLLDAALEERRKSKGKVAVVHLDISRFKEINDALGQSAGDRVLRAVAERIKANLSGNDFAARLGSNEFAVALTSTKCTEEVVTFVNKLREALNASYWVNSEDISCTFYMGAAVAPSDGDDPASLARHANLALNRAKSQRAGRFEFFERSMDIAFQRRRERETDLRNAVSNGEFELVFQPQICVARYAISGQEALLRWHHPVHGTISPAYFIPLAEETGLIIPIGEWVLRQACEQAVSWEMPLNVAVNLSPVQFENGRIAETVARVLEETGLDPARLELEITETTLMGGLFLAQLPVELSVQQDQDRQDIHPVHHARRSAERHRKVHHRDGAVAGRHDHR